MNEVIDNLIAYVYPYGNACIETLPLCTSESIQSSS
jgi:hypothetical protein